MPSPGEERAPSVADTCPACGQAGKRVQVQTVKAMLKVTLRRLREVDYLFCRNQNCPVVYFTADGEQTFTTAQVRERVYQKEPGAADVYVCYCFRHTVGAVGDASLEKAAAIVADIKAGIQAGQCACEIRNPQGSCCLGHVQALLNG